MTKQNDNVEKDYRKHALQQTPTNTFADPHLQAPDLTGSFSRYPDAITSGTPSAHQVHTLKGDAFSYRMFHHPLLVVLEDHP